MDKDGLSFYILVGLIIASCFALGYQELLPNDPDERLIYEFFFWVLAVIAAIAYLVPGFLIEGVEILIDAAKHWGHSSRITESKEYQILNETNVACDIESFSEFIHKMAAYSDIKFSLFAKAKIQQVYFKLQQLENLVPEVVQSLKAAETGKFGDAAQQIEDLTFTLKNYHSSIEALTVKASSQVKYCRYDSGDKAYAFYNNDLRQQTQQKLIEKLTMHKNEIIPDLGHRLLPLKRYRIK